MPKKSGLKEKKLTSSLNSVHSNCPKPQIMAQTNNFEFFGVNLPKMDIFDLKKIRLTTPSDSICLN